MNCRVRAQHGRSWQRRGKTGAAKCKDRVSSKMRERHGSAGVVLPSLVMVAEPPLGLDALFGGRFACPFAPRACPLPFKTRARNLPVCDCALRATCSGVPVAMILPP